MRGPVRGRGVGSRHGTCTGFETQGTGEGVWAGNEAQVKVWRQLQGSVPGRVYGREVCSKYSTTDLEPHWGLLACCLALWLSTWAPVAGGASV